MNQSVGKGYCIRRCALGALIALCVELALLAAASALMLRGAIGEEHISGTVLASASLAAFAGCTFAGARTSRRTELSLLCAALFWVAVQVSGFIACGTLLPARSLMLAAAVLGGCALSLLPGRRRRAGKDRRNVRRRRR